MDQTNLYLDSKCIGVLPIVNNFFERLRFKELLEKYLPPSNKRSKIVPSRVRIY